jgi:hypothetical protein
MFACCLASNLGPTITIEHQQQPEANGLCNTVPTCLRQLRVQLSTTAAGARLLPPARPIPDSKLLLAFPARLRCHVRRYMYNGPGTALTRFFSPAVITVIDLLMTCRLDENSSTCPARLIDIDDARVRSSLSVGHWLAHTLACSSFGCLS